MGQGQACLTDRPQNYTLALRAANTAVDENLKYLIEQALKDAHERYDMVSKELGELSKEVQQKERVLRNIDADISALEKRLAGSY